MNNRQVIAIFIGGLVFLLAAFWAGLSVTRDDRTVGAADTSAAAAPAQAGAAPGGQTPGREMRYVVYVATYGTLQGAKEKENELIRRGYLSAYTQMPAGGDTLFKVNIGPYSSRAEAQKVANELAAEGFKGLMITGSDR